MGVIAAVDLLHRIIQRCASVSFGILVRSAPCDPGACVLSPLCRSASFAGFSDGELSPSASWE